VADAQIQKLRIQNGTHALEEKSSQVAGKSGDPTRFLDTVQATELAKAFVRQNWDVLLTNCPGLLDYGKDLVWAGVDDRGDSIYPANVRGIGIRLKVVDSPSLIPASFRSSGHTCSYRVTMDGVHLITEKTVCAEICFERSFPHQSSNQLFPLKRP
jgi:hypothetical protein